MNINEIMTHARALPLDQQLALNSLLCDSIKHKRNIENLNAYAKLLINGRAEKAFNLSETFPPKGNPEAIESLKQLSYLTFGGNREEIEKGILEKYRK